MTNTKNKKNNTKKLLGAIGMLSISAAMLVSSTFAWFSLNKTVTAQTMSVTAKSDNPFLQISGTSASTGFDTNYDIQLASKELRLTTPLNTGIKSSDVTSYYANATASTAATTTMFAAPSSSQIVKWGYAVSSSTSEVQATNIPTLLSDADAAANHYLVQDLWIKVADQGADATNLVASCTVTPGTNSIPQSIRVLMVTDNGAYLTFDKDGLITARSSSATGQLAATLTSTKGSTAGTVEHVKVYVYFDGTGADAKTDNANSLTEVTVAMEFNVDLPNDNIDTHDQPTGP